MAFRDAMLAEKSPAHPHGDCNFRFPTLGELDWLEGTSSRTTVKPTGFDFPLSSLSREDVLGRFGLEAEENLHVWRRRAKGPARAGPDLQQEEAHADQHSGDEWSEDEPWE